MQYFDAEAGAELKAAFDELVDGWSKVSQTTMFGCPSYQADGELFAVLTTDAVTLTRIPEDRRAEVIDAFDAGPFQAGDRTVTKWVQVPIDDPSEIDALESDVRMSYEAALKA